MKRVLLFIVSLFMIFGNVSAKNVEPLELVTVVNKCSVVRDNSIVVPVRVVSKNNGELSTLIDEYTLDYVDNHRDNIDINITNIEGVSNVIVDNNRDGNGRSLIRYYIDEDIKGNKLDTIFSFDIQVKFLDSVPDSMYILGTEVIISDKEVCEEINGYQVSEIEKVKYVDLSKVDHSEMINSFITKCIIGILIVVIIILIVLLKRKKK